ncbi:MAG: xanthine dehydrogenase family protein molybdopterin-binding subunit [Thermodesulfobacteriota bacterium]
MILGTSPIRTGARERALGQTRFGVDLGQPGDLFLACVRARQAPARILAIDPAPALALAGVARVFTAADVPGINRLGIIPVTKDQEFLADGLVRCAGQAVALVAAETAEAARAGARAVAVSLAEEPGVFDAAQALVEGAPLVHPGREKGNLLDYRVVRRGDVEAALAASAVVVTADYSTSMIEHAALETEGGRAWIDDGRLVVSACTQNPHYDRDDIARFLGLAPDQVVVIQAETGGGFGGKLDVSVQPYLALAAWLMKRPVRMAFTREESFLATAKRHPFAMRYTSGADAEGRLTAVKAELLADSGAFASYGLAVCMRAAVHATGPYFVPNVDVTSRMAYTNNAWAGAMRGFGVPQVALAHEGQMDALADALGMDRLKFRLINALRPGQATATGQVLESGVGIVACLEKIEPIHRAWSQKAQGDDRWAEGVGLGAMYYGIGNTGVSNPSTAQIEWTADGRLVLYTGVADIGQGSDTVLSQIAAARLGVELARIDLVRGDTGRTTNAGATSASRQTYISGNAVMAAAENLEALILGQARKMLGHRHQELTLDGGIICAKGGREPALSAEEVVRALARQGARALGQGAFDPHTVPLDPATGQGKPYAAYAFAAQCAWVAVDRDSGMVRVREVAAAHDVGRAVNPKAVMGQICGGIMMGVGLALMEEFKPGSTQNFEDYHIPTAADAPRITPLIVEEPEATGPYGAKGVGEPALIPTAPAVAAAVGRALGRPMRDLPISLERVMQALAGAGGEDQPC